MQWEKRKNIFTANGNHAKMHSHAQIPVPLKLDESIYRIYFSSRDTEGKTHPYCLDYDFKKDEILYIEKTPLLSHGIAGSFDDCGIMPSSALRVGDKVFLYYIAWNTKKTVPYHLSIGLAVSSDNGKNFTKFAEAPVMDRCLDEPFFNTAPCVIEDGGIFKMWYVSTTAWKEIKGIMEPQYLVRYAQSNDGIHWQRHQDPVIDYEFASEAIGRPWVLKEEGGYRMWYSKRGLLDYRIKGGQHYIIGYGESKDGLNWQRKDEGAGIAISPSGWDSEMMEYCSVIDLGDRYVMLYNGNKFGLTGFGYAESLKS